MLPADANASPSSERESESQGSGRVRQVNISLGGVPKLPVAEAYVDELGLAGDRHHDDSEHGGPHRAVALFAIEAIRRVAQEGHPIGPGMAGENLTTEGIELAALPVGTRLAIGPQLLLEISKPDNPCKTIAASFRDGRFSRISILTSPLDSRMYARVLRPGTVHPDDRILVLPPAADSQARLHELLDRLEAVERSSCLHFWRGAREAGHDVRILDDGELAAAAAPALAHPIFNTAHGLRQLPNLLGRMLDFYRQAEATGWLVAGADAPPWPGARGERARAVLVAPPANVDEAPAVPDLKVRLLPAAEVERWSDVSLAGWNVAPELARAFRAGTRASATVHDHFLFGAELGGQLVGTGRLDIRRGVALMGGATVHPDARRRGIHRALIAARAGLAAEHACEWLAAAANAGSTAQRNLEAMGLRSIWTRTAYRFEPADPEAPPVSEAGLAQERIA
ncbi:MAG: GNAT family N-acetyltransferase [Candidatus Limnocylindrales bacterium]